MKHLKKFNEQNSEESPIQEIIDRMFMRINEPDVKTKKLAQSPMLMSIWGIMRALIFIYCNNRTLHM
jgi:hypothetical protein